MFQFHKVRLKGKRGRQDAPAGSVSIPQGTIKRLCVYLRRGGFGAVSIPQGTIKRQLA